MAPVMLASFLDFEPLDLFFFLLDIFLCTREILEHIEEKSDAAVA